MLPLPHFGVSVLSMCIFGQGCLQHGGLLYGAAANAGLACHAR
jgi:hypothetical protein